MQRGASETPQATILVTFCMLPHGSLNKQADSVSTKNV